MQGLKTSSGYHACPSLRMSSQELDHSKTTLRTLIYKVQTINISKPNASSLWNTVLNLMVSLMTCVSTFTTGANAGTKPG